jgi:hypothetical protein
MNTLYLQSRSYPAATLTTKGSSKKASTDKDWQYAGIKSPVA